MPRILWISAQLLWDQSSDQPLAVGRKVICIGGTVHHLMAGYGGGRKSIVPIIAGRETIRHNHAMALDPHCEQSDPRVGPANSTITRSMKTCVKQVHCFIQSSASILLSTPLPDTAVFSAVTSMPHGGKAASMSSNVTVFRSKDQADVVFVSCGGFPKALNFYQGSKSLFNAVRAVKPGGTLVMLAECSEGAGAKDFFDWLTPLRERAILIRVFVKPLQSPVYFLCCL